MQRTAAIALLLLGLSGCDILTALGGGRNLPCENDEACSPGNLCVEQRCQPVRTCSSDGDCPDGQHCAPASRVCVWPPDAAVADAAGLDARIDAAATDRATADRVLVDTARADQRWQDRANDDAQPRDHGGATDNNSATEGGIAPDQTASDSASIEAGAVDSVPADHSSPDGSVLPGCGNGFVVRPEDCDDANLRNGDGCSASCAVEPFYACSGQPSQCRCVHYVNGQVGANGDGSSWTWPLRSIQPAIDATPAGCAVWVAAWTYYVYETAAGDTVRLKDGVDLYGGFAGTERSIDQRNLKANQTVLDGFDSNQSAQVEHVVTAANLSGAVFDGFVVQHGSSTADGGGMLVSESTITIGNCRFIDNTAVQRGGAIFAKKAAQETSVVIFDTSFSSNSADTGGAVDFADGATGELRNCLLANNIAQSHGGGLSLAGGAQATVASSVFYGNTGAGQFASGAIRNNSSSLTVINSTLAYNTGGSSGAAVTIADPTYCLITNSILWGNAPDELVSFYGSCDVEHSDVAGGYVGSNNLDADPLFQDITSRNLRLTRSSPCIDVGDDPKAPLTDIDGVFRVDIPDLGNEGTKADLGAYEYFDTP